MKAKLIGMLISTILSLLTPALVRQFVDIVLDFIEERVLGSKSTVDDALVLPVCKLVREAFGIPDDDGTYSPLPREIAPQSEDPPEQTESSDEDGGPQSSEED